jgi:ATP-dependent RNA helicase DDX46/PRP5
MTFGKFKVEVKRGRAPDSTMGGTSVADAARMVRLNKLKSDEAALQKAMRDAEEEAKRSGRNTGAYKNAQNVVAKLNALIRASKLALSQGAGGDDRKKDVDSSEFHAIVPINDYPQKARWKVTNKETMSQVSLALIVKRFLVM